MCNKTFRDHTEMLYKETKILNVSQLYIYHVCLFMYRYTQRLLPTVFDSMYHIISSVHDYHTRNNLLFVLPYCRTEIRKKSIVYNGAYYCNLISKHIKLHEIHSISCFKRKIKNVVYESFQCVMEYFAQCLLFALTHFLLYT